MLALYNEVQAMFCNEVPQEACSLGGTGGHATHEIFGILLILDFLRSFLMQFWGKVELDD